MKKILLEREYTRREIEEKESKKNTINDLLNINSDSFEKIEKARDEYFKKLEENNSIFILKILEIEDLKPILSEISKLLEEDKVQLKKEEWLSD